VVLKFTIGMDGGITGQAIVRSSGHGLLDAAAQETLHKVGHFPPLPATLGRSHLTIQVPLSFRLAVS
jgi:protein TonB